jgi:mannose-1-phosphate guanylyltransferase
MDNIIIQHETDILGTGGGLRRAMPSFGNEPVLVTNGDIYHTADLKDIYSRHLAQRNDVTLVMHNYPRFNQVSVNQQSCITGFDKMPGQASDRLLAFTGIHVINPEVLQLIPAEQHYSIIECYTRWLNQGNTIRALQVDDLFWSDMGTPEDYLKLHGDLLSGNDISAAGRGPFLVAGNVQLGKNVQLQDWACIGQNSSIGDNATICRSIVWGGAVVKENEHVRDAIIT